MPAMRCVWPGNKAFAFSICDDTDNGTLENLRPIYDLLARLGIRTTKTVWSAPVAPGDRFTGQSLADPEYAAWVQDLARQGFEIGWHGNRSGGSTRQETLAGLETFRQALGHWPRTYANHADNVENIYWGPERFDNPLIRALYRSTTRRRFEGSTPGSPFYWVDVCGEYLTYVRDFTFHDIVTTNVDRWMPYWDPHRPHVKAWFSSSDAADADAFVRLLRVPNLDRLQASGGACILYVHFASGFARDGRVRPDVVQALTELAVRPGWYAPVAEILDYISARRGIHRLTRLQRLRLELQWAREHLGSGLHALRRRRRP
jgi:hypothetical protein